ncbi:winged helix-turn-helix transcriptional regulator [Methanonatronarchaeum sp. AMET-Sl]|uniref:winged helix-turn-helix transcriptional regulator n=1 Tax=Methanonatronarchaeum sp. AMET-Sl TaxID=3037654 RepID=UPI00244E1218|nr:winged helix-turn-helix transcriptional regulator [Methanonatronarchaeum sp. AMET-Sl]WGI17080.1 winged helix-turn-helix transcriptional regulator [Methanonatronarchaeum sp. AMET-Sl]
MLTENLGKEVDLLRRHIKVLKVAYKKGPIGMGHISEITGLPKHKVRYSLRVLEREGLIEPSTEGAKVQNMEKFQERFNEDIDCCIQELEEIRNHI